MKDRLNREEAEAVAGEYNFSVFSGGLGIGNLRTNLKEKAEQLKEEKADSGMETGKQGEKF